MRVFLGVTGASGAAYAGGALRALTGAGCEVGLCVSDAGAHVISHEIMEAGPGPPDDPALVVASFVERFAAGPGSVSVLGLNDLTAPFASGSSQAPAALIAPCSGSTLAAIATGAARNLIHRCADVMLKERRRLVLVTRETPLSLIHIENMAAVTRAGAVVLPAMPGFYTLPRTVEDMVDFVVGKALHHLGVPNELVARWGEGAEAARGGSRERVPDRHPARGRGAGDVRPHRAPLRPAQPRDDRRPRRPLAAGGGGGRRPGGRRPGARRLHGNGDLALELAHRTTGRGEAVGVDFSEQMVARARAKAERRGSPARFEVADALALPFDDGAFDAATVAFGIRNVADLDAGLAEMARVVRPGGRVVVLEITTPARLRRFYGLWFDRVVPRLGRVLGRDGAAYSYLPASVRRFPEPPELAARMAAAGLDGVSWRPLAGGIVAVHHGRVAPR